MANTRTEIVDAAIADGILADASEGDGMTKADLLSLWYG
jgi:hypothetical protein